MHKKLGKAERDFVVVNGDAGIASDVIDSEKGTKKRSIFYKALSHINANEDLAEELRILYVAMTRAKEKLIFTDRVDDTMWLGNSGFYSRVTAGSYFDWVLPVAARSPIFEYVEVNDEELQNLEMARQIDQMLDEKMLNNFDTSVVYDKKQKKRCTLWMSTIARLKRKFRQRFPFPT